EPLVAPSAQQKGLGAQRLVERELVEPWAVFDQADPATAPEAFVTGRVLDNSVECDVLADDDLSHWCSSLLVLSVTRARSADARIVRAVDDAGAAAPGKWAPTNRPVRPPAGVYTRWKCDKGREAPEREGSKPGRA